MSGHVDGHAHSRLCAPASNALPVVLETPSLDARSEPKASACLQRQSQAKIRQILDQKEQIALDTVENDMKKRLGVLSSEVSLFSSVIPELNTILEQTQKALKMSQSDSQTFIAQANALVATIQDKTHKAAALSPPTDNADFENLSLNLLPPGS